MRVIVLAFLLLMSHSRVVLYPAMPVTDIAHFVDTNENARPCPALRVTH